MKKNVLNFICLAAIVSMVSISCKKDDAPAVVKPLASTSKTNFVADGSLNGNHFSFFSLERNEAVAFTDSATSKWDIGIRATSIIINGGTTGLALGGAFIQTSVSFDSYKTIPTDSAFRVNTPYGTPWYTYNALTHVIAPNPGSVIIVRTATGKYAKLEILSYYKDAPTAPTETSVARYYTFRFIYQPDGTKTF